MLAEDKWSRDILRYQPEDMRLSDSSVAWGLSMFADKRKRIRVVDEVGISGRCDEMEEHRV